jgi:hypothetical protein
MIDILTDPPALFVIMTLFYAAYVQRVGNRQNKKWAFRGYVKMSEFSSVFPIIIGSFNFDHVIQL